MQTIRLNSVTGVPVFRQIVEQIVYMIEMGQLNDGDRLPSSRMLADNLHVNRNTVVRAYAELRKRDLVSRQGRNGMVVRGGAAARERLVAREQAHRILTDAVARCLEFGLSAEEIASLAYQHSLHAQRTEIRLAFVECNGERSDAFAEDLGEALDIPIAPLVLGDIKQGDVEDRDLVITTFFHLAEVRRLLRDLVPDAPPEVLAIVVAPHVKTLVRLSQIPAGHRIGIYYTTEDQSEVIRLSLADAGVHHVDVISGPDDPVIAECDLVVVPNHHPEMAAQLEGKVPVIEFGNVLDAGSIRMVSEVVDDLRERKGSVGPRPAPVPAAPAPAAAAAAAAAATA